MTLMQKLKLSLLILPLLLIVGDCFAIVQPISEVLRLDNSSGLGSQKVYSILEDKNGAIWISTKAGVDRYNGRIVKNYALGSESFHEDMAGRVVRLEYSNNNLYAYDTSGRIYLYSNTFDSFQLYLNLSDQINDGVALNKFIHTSDNYDIFALYNGLFILKENEPIKPIITNIFVNDVLLTKKQIFLGTSTGLKILKKDLTIHDIPSLQGLDVISLFHDDKSNLLYIGTFDDGLWVLNEKDNSARKIHINSELLAKPIRSIIEITPEDLAIGVDGNGVLTLNKKSEALQTLVNTDLAPEFAFIGNGIYALNTDCNNNLWIGSYTGGATMIGFESFPIQILTHRTDNINSISSNNVNSIIENSDGAIWYATDRGISIASSNGLKWKHTLKNDVVVTMCTTSSGDMLAGCYGDGLYLLDKSGNIKNHWSQKSGDLPIDYIFSIKIDSADNIWLGSPHGPLTMLNPKHNTTRQFGIDKVLSISILNNGNICACTVDGFYIINPQTYSYTWYANHQELEGLDLSSYLIQALFDDNNSVWLGSEGGGLMLYDLHKRKIIRSIKTSDGLPSNDIYSLQKDNCGRIWVGTGNGIAVVQDSTISSLNYINGLTNEYNKLSTTKLKSGDLIFGSTAGAVRFNPDKISIADYSANLRINNLLIEGISDENYLKLLPSIRQMLDNYHVSLPHNLNSFQVVFEAINIRFRNDISYRYIMESYDKDWSETSYDGMARFKNLPPGNYTLHIVALQKSSGQILDEKSIKISISEPWWNTLWAWLLYILIFGLLICVFARYQWYKLRKRHDEDKIRFFINTAHDIRTPLSLVMAPLEELNKEDSLSDNAQHLLGIANNNMRKLNAITSQLLDFEKIDSNKANVKLEPINLNYLLSEEVSCFKNVCDKKSIELILNLSEEDIVIFADRHLIELMLDNLLSNACKYTPQNGRIDIYLTSNKNKAVITVSDTGIGIPDKDQKNIFSNVYRAENARATQETGNGFGLLQVKRIVNLLNGNISFISKEGKGTSFTICFKRVYNQPTIQWNPTSIATTSLDEISKPTPDLNNSVISSDKTETILIVEDNDDLRNFLASTFKSDYNVVSTISANDALSFLENHYPDLILSDVMMPGIQGDEFCRMVKSNPDTAGIPVILLTAKTNHDAIIEGLEMGADDYIPKPFSLDILKTKIKGMLSNRDRIRTYLLNQAVKKVESIETNSPIQTESNTSANECILSESDSSFVNKATNIVIENISDADFDIESLCREMAMSRTLFYSRLKSLTGKGPQEFIRILRLEYAADLLRKEVPVNEVAEKSGFANSKYFSTIFKKHFGISPSKYTKE